MKIALLNDTHYDYKNGSDVFQRMINRFFDEQFFPYLDKHGIKKIIHLGDLIDKRKLINFNSLKAFKEGFVEKVVSRNIEVDIILGNHDVFYKNTNELNSPSLLCADVPNFTIYENAQDVNGILYIPWVCKNNYQHTLEVIKNSKSKFAMGHLELAGFRMMRGFAVSEHGTLDKALLGKFSRVFSGHFHHKSDDGHIYYLGTQYDLSWSDYDDPKGFHVFDTETDTLEFIENPIKQFIKIFYNDEKNDYSKPDLLHLKEKCVKLVVEKKQDLYTFDRYVETIMLNQPNQLSILEDTIVNNETQEDELEHIDDTYKMIDRYVDDNFSSSVELKKLMKDLHMEVVSND